MMSMARVCAAAVACSAAGAATQSATSIERS